MQNLAYPAEKEETFLDFGTDLNPSAVPPAAEGPELDDTPAAFARPSVQSHLEVEDKVKRAEEQLAALQQKRELLEQQKQALQQLSEKRQNFTEGKNEVVRVLTEALPELREEAEEAQRRSEFLRQMREVFSQHLEVLKTVKPEDWDESEIKVELDRGTTALEEAKTEIECFEERLATYASRPVAAVKPRPASDADFTRWMKMGFAFALPGMIFTAFALVIAYLVLAQ